MSYEISRKQSENMRSRHVVSYLQHLIKHKLLLAIWIGITCAFFSRARRGKPDHSGWPPPLRDNSGAGLYGRPGLSKNDQHKVQEGSKLVTTVCF